MKLKIIAIILLSYLLSSCSRNKTEKDDVLVTIDIKSAFENRKPVTIDDISDNWDYVTLETTNESLIGSNASIYSDDQYLIAIERRRILLFDRESGKFIRTIGNSGNGPDEYTNTYSKMPYNEEKRIIYASKSRERLEYNLDGQFIKTRNRPELAHDFVNINENTFASFIDNFMGEEKNKIIVFDDRDSIIKIFPNYLSFPFKGSVNIYTVNAWFYKLDKF